jgi:hypothetical protein
LIAESTGKSGKGIVPVVGEEQVEAEYYGEDRFFVHIRLESDESSIERVSTLEEASHPIFEIVLNDTYDLGGQYFLWEMATAVAGHSLGIHPFNQPNVEAAKVLAKKMEQAYVETGELPKGETFPVGAGQLKDFLSRAKPGDYIALQTYIKPESETSTALQALRTRMQKKLKTATTVGYGPRFLHSTGQLHKGDRGNGLFIQFISPPDEDAGIPDEAGREESSITFGILKQAQALGDAQALREAGRRVISFEVDANPASQIEALSKAFD